MNDLFLLLFHSKTKQPVFDAADEISIPAFLLKVKELNVIRDPTDIYCEDPRLAQFKGKDTINLTALAAVVFEFFHSTYLQSYGLEKRSMTDLPYLGFTSNVFIARSQAGTPKD